MSDVLSVRGLHVVSAGAPDKPIIDGIDFDIARGEIVALVGESGAGKSVLALSLLRLLHPSLTISQGSVDFLGRDLLTLDDRSMRQLRGDRISMIFQDPTATLNPVLPIGTQITEAIRAHKPVNAAIAWDKARDALAAVGIPSPGERLASFPHQMSGGMRQRVAIAIALINQPDLVLADEPTTALDVTIQSQILALVSTLVRSLGTALLWISHDLAVVASLADRVCVMYGGQIVEAGSVDEVLTRPRHPYTAGLIGSIPDRAKRGMRLHQIPGCQLDPGSRPGHGCRFAQRCSRCDDACRRQSPVFEGDRSHGFRCFHPDVRER